MTPNGLSDVGVDSREKGIPNFVPENSTLSSKKLAKAALGAARYGKTWLGHGQDRASP